MKTTHATLQSARLGSISDGTLRTEDLLSTFISALEGMILINADIYALPENQSVRDRLNNLIGEAQDCFADDGTIAEDKQDIAEELVCEDLPDALSLFAPSYAYFGSHEGDGACIGWWANIEDAKESCEFVSSKSQDYPDDDFRGEWLHVNDHGNCTLYVRRDKADGSGCIDAEVWSCV